MKLTYFGHSCFLVNIKGFNVLFDPFIRYNELAKNIDINSIAIDYLFISHGHEDHIADAIDMAKRTNCKVVGSWEVVTWLGKQGIENIHPMNTGGQWNFEFGTVKCTAAQHSSSLPDGSYGGNPMGFLFTTTEGNFYYSGDTALTLDMQLVSMWASLHFAALPIGDNFTMGIDDAIKAAEMIQCYHIVGVHYDTFGYIKIDKEMAIEKFATAGKKLLLPAIGETIEV
jgi:L-ascorbate metabolism protein UlaG (beta-lactamase superfamily)